MRLSILLAVLAVPSLASSPKGGGVLRYKPTKADTADGRPTVIEATIKPQGTGFALDLWFGKGAWGPGCKTHCGSAELMIDVDADQSTGMQQGRSKPVTGADLDITIQGYSAGSEPTYLKAKVRQLTDEDRVPEDGDVIQEMDSRSDGERLQVAGTTVSLLIDASSGTLPAGKACRLIYLPPSSKAVTTSCKGLAGAIDSGKGVEVIKGQSQAGFQGGSGAARRSGTRSHSSSTSHAVTDPGAVKIDKGGSAYDPNEKNPFGEGG